MHACQRGRQMRLTPEEILQVVLDPEVDYEDHQARGRGKNARVAQRGDLAVPYDAETHRVITVLYRRADQWDRDQVTAQRRRGVRT